MLNSSSKELCVQRSSVLRLYLRQARFSFEGESVMCPCAGETGSSSYLPLVPCGGARCIHRHPAFSRGSLCGWELLVCVTINLSFFVQMQYQSNSGVSANANQSEEHNIQRWDNLQTDYEERRTW